MSEPHRHPFLGQLADDVELVSTALRGTVHGRAAVRAAVEAFTRCYRTQMPWFLDEGGGMRSYIDYDLALPDGRRGRCLVAVQRDPVGEVVGLNIAFSPLDVALAIAAGMRDGGGDGQAALSPSSASGGGARSAP